MEYWEASSAHPRWGACKSSALLWNPWWKTTMIKDHNSLRPHLFDFYGGLKNRFHSVLLNLMEDVILQVLTFLSDRASLWIKAWQPDNIDHLQTPMTWFESKNTCSKQKLVFSPAAQTFGQYTSLPSSAGSQVILKTARRTHTQSERRKKNACKLWFWVSFNSLKLLEYKVYCTTENNPLPACACKLHSKIRRRKKLWHSCLLTNIQTDKSMSTICQIWLCREMSQTNKPNH